MWNSQPSGSSIVALILLALAIIGYLWLFWFPVWRNRRILKQPFPHKWKQILSTNMKIYSYLPNNFRQRLNNLILLFLHQVDFYGSEGIEINDEIKITIAAQACLLILGRTIDDYAKIKSIIVYPYAYFTENDVGERSGIRLGESWQNGRIILAWDDVLHNSRNIVKGHNVTLHEFAHQLDQEDGYSDGVPPIPASAVDIWVQTFSHHFKELSHLARDFEDSFFNPYGATNPAEFFAVCSESFFTVPVEFSNHYPELFQLMLSFYQLDPRLFIPVLPQDQQQ